MARSQSLTGRVSVGVIHNSPSQDDIRQLNSSTAKLNILNVHPLKVVSCYRNPQLQVGENYNSSLRVLGCHLPLRGLTLQQFII